MIDLKSLSPEDLQQLKQVLGLPDLDPRAAMWKPLTDLRPATSPKKRLYRPHFEWSAEDDGLQVIGEFPRLYWDAQGVEHRVDADDEVIPPTWKPSPPMKAALVDPLVKLRDEFDALSAEDQQLVLEAQKRSRLSKLHELMAGLSDADLNALARKPADTKAKRSA